MREKTPFLRKISRLFVIKNRFEASAIIYAAVRWALRNAGRSILTQYPGFGGKLLFLACSLAVFMAGAKIMDAMRYEREAKAAGLEQPQA